MLYNLKFLKLYLEIIGVFKIASLYEFQFNYRHCYY